MTDASNSYNPSEPPLSDGSLSASEECTQKSRQRRRFVNINNVDGEEFRSVVRADDDPYGDPYRILLAQTEKSEVAMKQEAIFALFLNQLGNDMLRERRTIIFRLTAQYKLSTADIAHLLDLPPSLVQRDLRICLKIIRSVSRSARIQQGDLVKLWLTEPLIESDDPKVEAYAQRVREAHQVFWDRLTPRQASILKTKLVFGNHAEIAQAHQLPVEVIHAELEVIRRELRATKTEFKVLMREIIRGY